MRLGSVIGGAILVLLLAGVAVGAFMPPEAALRSDLAARFSPADATHLLGSDELGRDEMSRLAFGDAANAIVLAVFMAPAIAYMLHRIDTSPGDQGRTAMTHARPRVFPLALLATSLFGWAILLESALDAIGLGVQPPLPSWGTRLAQFSHYALGLSWRAMLPGLCLVLTALGAFLLGDAFQRRGQASW
jgi:ABC-type dipeptide/oligopeptide/nickel transport system permease subunit